MYEMLAALAAFIFAYSLLSGALERSLFSGAVVFTAFGLLFGPLGFGLLTLSLDAEGLRTLAELTLALVLFTDAANANLEELKHSFQLPGRLLLFGLPLTIALGYFAGTLVFPGLTWVEVAILATMLAPTDAALGKAVVTNVTVPSRIREGLNVESGLNDGICVPILFIFLAIDSTDTAAGGTSMLAFTLVSQAVGIAVVVAVGATLLSTWLIKVSEDRQWVTESWRQLAVPALAVSSFAIAQWLGGSGFIACFVGGLLFGGIEKQHKRKLLLAAEGTGDTLALITWVVFGAAIVGQTIGHFSWQVLLYALLSLTVVRMLPVFLIVSGMNLRTQEKLFLGWFGPRGLASIVFALIVLDEKLPGGDIISITAVCTILLSIILHGLTANPLIAALRIKLKRSGATP